MIEDTDKSGFRERDENMLPCKEYFVKIDEVRNERGCHMKKLYDSLGPVLIKLESLVLGTFSGRSQKMKEYYVYWESEAFQCILE